jgi:hypothetical protein
MFWPIHAGGRYASTSSLGLSLSNSAPAWPRSINVPWVCTTPFGLPVVPEVKNIAATSAAWALSTSALKKSGCSFENAAPAPISSSNPARPSSM